MNILEFSDVSFSYRGRLVLDEISFALEAAERTALIGRNGSGKTTLLRLAAGLLQPCSGTVILQGQPLTRSRARDIARLIAVVPQTLDVPFDFTAEQIVEQGRTPYLSTFGRFARKDRIAVEQAMDVTDTASLRDAQYNELSGGERQRVKLALALAQEPSVLLLDEPTQNLDIGRQREVIALFSRLSDAGTCLLVAIHDLHLVPGNFRSALMLRPSGKLFAASPDDVLREDVIKDVFPASAG